DAELPVGPKAPATQYTQQVNQNYAKSLPFSDRQDFDDAQRGFIAPLLDEGILRDANGKIYYRANDYKFVIAFTAASGMMINTAYATDEAKAATQ
ncbi:hypothetical protein AAIH17_36495, partial [Pseudomonas aeruginosa]